MGCMKIYTLLGFFMHVETSILCLLQNRKKINIYLVNSNLESARIILEIMKFIKLLIFIFMYILKYNIPLFTWNAKVVKQVIEVSKTGYCFLPTEAPSHQFCRWVGNSICSFWNQTIQCLKQKAKVSLLLTLTKTSFKITFFFFLQSQGNNCQCLGGEGWSAIPVALETSSWPWPGPCPVVGGLCRHRVGATCVRWAEVQGWPQDAQSRCGTENRVAPQWKEESRAKGGAFRWGRPASQQPHTASTSLESWTFSPDAAGSS